MQAHTMMDQTFEAHEIFPHIRIVMGMVIGLGIARLLAGVAKIVQHPKNNKLYPVHLAWTGAILLTMVYFWWWEFGLFQIQQWTFLVYLFVIAYAIVLFVLCALLYPDSLQGYTSYTNYFNDRRAWFFSALMVTFLLDVIDTRLKGEAHFSNFGPEYLIRTPILLALCLVAIWTPSRRFHLAFVLSYLAYQLSWIYRLSYTLT